MISIVNIVPKDQSNETHQDSEPNLSINPANPLQIVATAFTPDPHGGPNAPIYVSTDGGNTWTLNAIVPGGSPSSGTDDITERFSGTNHLYVGTLRGDTVALNVDSTSNFLLPGAIPVLGSRANEDQPWTQAATVSTGPDTGKDRLYVGNNDFNVTDGKTATIDMSLDAAAAGPTFSSIRIEKRSTAAAGQDGPSIRPTIHPDGTIYAAFYGWRNFDQPTSLVTSDVVVVRDDSWSTGANPFTALVDSGDNIAGVRVAQGITFTWNAYIGQQRLGGDLSIVVDPRNSSTVYLAWADHRAAGYTVHIQRSTDRGVTWGVDLLTIVNATNPALAINSVGAVALLYQQLLSPGTGDRWETHLRRTTDGALWTDDLLATTPADTPTAQFDPYLGDYLYLTAVDRDFYGIFCANNTPSPANFPNGVGYQRNANFATATLLGTDDKTPVAASIDPYFCKIVGSDVPHLSAASWAPNRLDVFIRGTDEGIYHKSWNGSAWRPSVTGYESLAGRIVGAPRAVSWGPDRLDIFARGIDGALYHKAWNGSAWIPSATGYENLGGQIVGPPTVVSWAPNRLDIFVRGTDGALYHKWWNGSAWGPSATGYENLGGVLVGPPTVVSWGPNRLDIFVRGTDGSLYHKAWNGSSWGPSVTGYENLGGAMAEFPAAVSWGPNRLDIFLQRTDGALCHKWWDGTSWQPSATGYENLGGTLVGSPAVASWGPNRLDVLVRQIDGSTYHKWFDGVAWQPSVTGYENLGGPVVGVPTAVSWGPSRLDVFVEGPADSLKHKWFDGTTWGPSMTGYQDLGGVLG
jgi:hypothetical protein